METIRRVIGLPVGLAILTYVLTAISTSGCAADPQDEAIDSGFRRDASRRDSATPRGPDGSISADPDATVVTVDECNNGLDDDGNGLIDDLCPCLPATTQRCFVGDPALAGNGACAWGVQTCVGAGEFGTWGACGGSGVATTETCDAVDNNCDGRVDEGCSCTIGMTRACYSGPPGTSNVGTCSDGTQICEMDAGNAVWGRCVGSVIPMREMCDHLDNNCDGRVDEPSMEICDGVDNNCDGHVDETCLCAAGQTATFHRTSAEGHGSGITAGAALFTMTCETMRCPEGQVAVLDGGATRCVPPPPPCPMGQQVDFTSGMLRCVPCELVIQYGSIYNNARVCADRPMIMCSHGQVPTFVYESRTWQCRPTCDNDLYDQIHVMGMLVCVPC